MPRSWQWFDRVYEAALAYYGAYQQADPLQRGGLRPDASKDLQDPTFARLESRAVQMLLQSLQDSVVSQARATLSSVGLLYQVLKQYQPGGLHERAELLKALTELPSSQSPRNAVTFPEAHFLHLRQGRFFLKAFVCPDQALCQLSWHLWARSMKFHRQEPPHGMFYGNATVRP